MPTWEETKRAGQTAFILQGQDFQRAPDSISDIYRQILTQGQIYPFREAESLTRQIAEGTLEPEAQKPEMDRLIEQEQDIEPGR